MVPKLREEGFILDQQMSTEAVRAMQTSANLSNTQTKTLMQIVGRAVETSSYPFLTDQTCQIKRKI